MVGSVGEKLWVYVFRSLGENHMNGKFHEFADEMVKQTELNQTDREVLYQEIMIYLEKEKMQFVAEGLTEIKAEQKAIESYLYVRKTGGEGQQNILPREKRMLIILAIASMVYSTFLSSMWLYVEKDVNIAWFLISVTSSTFIYIYAVKPIDSLRSRLFWLRIALIINMFTYIFGAFIIWGLEKPVSTVLSLLVLFIILLNIVLISLISVRSKRTSKHSCPKQVNLLHALNIVAGIIICVATLLMLWLFLVFSFDLSLFMSFIFLPFFIWLISYILQIKFITLNKKQIAYTLAAIPVLLSIVIVVFSIRLIFV